MRGHVGLRLGAGPRQPGEHPGVQGAIGKHARSAIGTDGQAESAGHQPPPFDLRQGVRAARVGDQVRASTGEKMREGITDKRFPRDFVIEGLWKYLIIFYLYKNHRI